MAVGLAGIVAGMAQPLITRQPTGQSVSPGADVEFRIYASGTPPLTFQWRHNDVDLVSATNRILSITNVQVLEAGSYTFVVSDANGSATSAPALLDVDPTFTKITTGPLVSDITRRRAAAWADYDNDGYPDCFIHECDPAPKDVLYRNNGDGTFDRIVEPSLQGKTPQNGGFGAAWADYDNDGHLDLFIANHGGANVLFRNQADGTFARNSSPSIQFGSDSDGVAWGDYDRDGYLDLFLVNGYLGQNVAVNWLYRNLGDGAFARMTTNEVGAIAGDRRKWAHGCWVDYDDDGWPDVCAPSGNTVYLYGNQGDGLFVGVTNAALGVVNWPALTFAWADYDNDGRLDLFVGMDGTHPNVLCHQEASGAFKQMTAAEVGPVVSDTTYFGGVAWGDYDNDGFLDLSVAGGWLAAGFQYVSRKSFLYRNNGDGSFTRIGSGSPSNEVGYSVGTYWVDYDGDGYLDLLTTDYVGANRLYRNNGNSNNWLAVNCVGTSSSRDGTGTKVRALAEISGQSRWQLRLINSGGTCWGGQSFEAHFGLGDATIVDTLRIEWPSGSVLEMHNVAARQHLTVTEPASLEVRRAGEVRIRSWKGMAFEVQSSLDLENWQPVATVTNLTGTLEFTDDNAVQRTAGFYRVMHR